MRISLVRNFATKRLGPVALAVAVLAAAPSICAAPPDLRDYRRETPFEHRHPLLIRFSAALSRSVPNGEAVHRVERDRLERGFRRAARDTLKSLFLDSGAGRGEFLSRHERESRSTTSSCSGPGDDRVRLRLRVSHLVPGIEMRTSLGRGALGVSVNALGQVAADLSAAGSSGAQVRVGLDPSSRRLDLAARFSF